MERRISRENERQAEWQCSLTEVLFWPLWVALSVSWGQQLLDFSEVAGGTLSLLRVLQGFSLDPQKWVLFPSVSSGAS